MGYLDKCVLRLHDCAIESYVRCGPNIAFTIRMWNQAIMELTVFDVVFLQEQMGDDDLEGLFEAGPSAVLDQATDRLKALRWSDDEISQLKHYQFLDLAARPVLDVVGKRWEQVFSTHSE